MYLQSCQLPSFVIVLKLTSDKKKKPGQPYAGLTIHLMLIPYELQLFQYKIINRYVKSTSEECVGYFSHLFLL